jgi:hypothetical protein
MHDDHRLHWRTHDGSQHKISLVKTWEGRTRRNEYH